MPARRRRAGVLRGEAMFASRPLSEHVALLAGRLLSAAVWAASTRGRTREAPAQPFGCFFSHALSKRMSAWTRWRSVSLMVPARSDDVVRHGLREIARRERRGVAGTLQEARCSSRLGGGDALAELHARCEVATVARFLEQGRAVARRDELRAAARRELGQRTTSRCNAAVTRPLRARLGAVAAGLGGDQRVGQTRARTEVALLARGLEVLHAPSWATIRTIV